MLSNLTNHQSKKGQNQRLNYTQSDPQIILHFAEH